MGARETALGRDPELRKNLYDRLTNKAVSAVVLSVLLMAVLPVFAAENPEIPKDDKGLPQWQIRQWNDAPVRLELADQAAVRQMLAQVTLADFTREDLTPGPQGWVVETRVTPAEEAALLAAGYALTRLPDREKEGRQAAEKAWAKQIVADKSDVAAVNYYPTHAQIGTLLADLATNYPTICRTFSMGQSVQGRELWGLVVSGDVNNTAAEPEVLLTSTMHGDEVVGMSLLVNLAHHLVENFGQPGYTDLTDLVNTTEIHIMPLHNPDGYVAGTRYNADFYDLNRNFPLPTGFDPVTAIENLNYMAYANAHHFVVSENGHGGALVVNYPWDYTYTLAPDDLAMIQLSLEYSTTNLPMFNGSFTDGITNGAAWYRVDGGLQDWAYDQTGCINVTIEVSNIKWPHVSTLPGFWDDNRESFLNFIDAADFGVSGVVTDSINGNPLDALVTVTGNVKTVSTDPAHGDYYKLVDTGTHELTFSADGYHSKTVSGVSTVWGTPTVLDVQLAPVATPVPGTGHVMTAIAAWPNPFNPSTKLAITVPTAGPVALAVYDLQGRVVRSLLAADLAAGVHPVIWDGRSDAGTVLPSGVYFARARTIAGQATTKLLLIK